MGGRDRSGEGEKGSRGEEKRRSGEVIGFVLHFLAFSPQSLVFRPACRGLGSFRIFGGWGSWRDAEIGFPDKSGLTFGQRGELEMGEDRVRFAEIGGGSCTRLGSFRVTGLWAKLARGRQYGKLGSFRIFWLLAVCFWQLAG